MKKILHLWDVANTLFLEEWNSELSGFVTFEDYQVSLGVDLNNSREYESSYEEPYKDGKKFTLQIAEGFKEVLVWTKNNEIFTSGIKEQMDWRAHYLNPIVGYDIRNLFGKVNTTFDYGETNIKTKAMLVEFLQSKKEEGYNVVVYTDDKIENCLALKEASDKLDGLDSRIYHILNDNNGLRKKEIYWEIGNLYDLLENEKTLTN